mmetsp:Transcript_123545/g.218850  ORF Transcript_123545/g.218850 Transcript_123545/m.218850 type:complete len:239 (-) Transcript_123545:55-771(-)
MSATSSHEASMDICVAEFSGRTHDITDLKPSHTVKQLYDKLEKTAEQGTRMALVVGDQVLNYRHLNMELRELGIRHGMTLALVRVCQSELFETSERVGDEDTLCQAGSEQSTVVRFAFTSDNTCILIRQTYAKFTTGTFIWDICRGTYTLAEEGNLVNCMWHQCHRRRRSAIEQSNGLSIIDSGWVRKEKVPQSWNQLKLSGGSWRRNVAMFQDRDGILGIRLGGPGNCAEAIQLLAL